MNDQPIIARFDYKFFGVVFLIAGSGLLAIYSVTHSSGLAFPLALKQLAWIGLGGIVFIASALIDYRKICRLATPLFGISLLLLIAVHFSGQVGQGAQRWISIGPLNIQPSELLKVALILVLARILSERAQPPGLGFSQLPIPLLVMAVPVFLIVRQPDLGTALSVCFLFLVMLFLAGLRPRSVIFGLLVFLMLFPFLWHLFWSFLKDYQRDRLLTFLNPAADPLGTGYHVIQSKIAVGSGGWIGQGFLEGTQSQLKFLPMGHTDFIFSVFAEEWGFIGVFLLLSLYLILILWGVETAYTARDPLGSFIAGGATAVLFFQIGTNIGMTLGLSPVVGIPLPLMSYGGSSMVTTMALLGLMMNVKTRRFMLS